MTTPTNPPPPPDEPEELGSSYETLFQTWIALVLIVICIALVSYLAMFLKK